MVSRRIVLTAIALLLGYTATYLGDGVRVLIGDLPYPTLISVFWFGVTLVLGVFGSIAAFIALVTLAEEWDKTARDDDYVVFVSFCITCLAMVFGVLARPFTNYGPYPWQWTSMWDLILLIALVPLILIIHSIVVDLVKH